MCSEVVSDIDISEIERLRRELRQSQETCLRLQAESEIYQRIASSTTIDQFFDEILQYCHKLWGVEAIGVQYLDDDTRQLVHFCYQGLNCKDLSQYLPLTVPVPLNDRASVCARVAVSKKSYYADISVTQDLSNQSSMDRAATESADILENLLVPIIHEDRSIGVIHLTSFSNEMSLSQQEISDIEIFIQSISSHIELIRRNEQLQRTKTAKEKSFELLSRISSTINLDDLLNILGSELTHFSGVDGYQVNLSDSAGGNLICEAVSLPAQCKALEATIEQYRYPLNSDDATISSFLNNQVITVTSSNVNNYGPTTLGKLHNWNIKQLVIIPIRAVGGEASLQGTLELFSTYGNISETQIQTIGDLLLYFIGPLSSAHRFHSLQGKEQMIERASAEQLRFISFIEQINNLTSVNQVCQRISAEFLRQFGFDAACVLLKEGKYLPVEITTYRKPEYKELSRIWYDTLNKVTYEVDIREGAFAVTYLNNRPMVFPDIRKIINLPMSRKDKIGVDALSGLRTMVQIPIRKEGDAIGVFCMITMKDVKQLKVEDMGLIEHLCGFMGSAIANARLYTKVEEQRNEIQKALESLGETQQRLVQTERRRAEAMEMAKIAAEQSVETKSAFLANMSHELRTPMNSIIGLSDIALRKFPKTQHTEYLQKIRQSSDILLNLINDILDLSKIEAGKLEIEQTVFSIRELLDGIETLFSAQFESKSIGLIINCDESMPKILVGDPLRLQQIIINLTNNAYKFTQVGSVTIDVMHNMLENDQIGLTINVTDTGVGIPDDKLPSIFDSFSQVDSSVTRKFGGTGLGLSICKSLAVLMNGDISVSSEIGKGSCFSVFVKVGNGLEIEDGLIGQKSEIETIDLSVLKGRKILVAEDNPINQMVAEELLVEIGVETVIANDGVEALELLERHSFDLLLTDIQMPNLDGYGLVSKIKSQEKFKDLIIVAMTAHAQQSDREKCCNAGMNDYVSKPIDIDELYRTLARCLGGAYVTKTLQTTSEICRFGDNSDTDSREPVASKSVDLRRALAQVGGNQRLLRVIFEDFLKQYGDIDQRIENLAVDAVDEVRLLIHPLKGLAGTLAAQNYLSIVLNIEQTIRNVDRVKLFQLIDDFKSEHQRLIAHLNQLVSFVLKGDSSIGHQTDGNDPVSLMAEFLTNHDHNALDEVAILEQAFHGQCDLKCMEQMRLALINDDFSQASFHFEQFRQEIKSIIH